MKEIPNTYFSILPYEIRYSDISDFAKLVWAEIYVINWQGRFEITNGEIAKALNRSAVQVSRAIAELETSNIIHINGERSKRRLAVNRYALQIAIKPKGQEPITQDNEQRRAILNEFLQSLTENIPDLIGKSND
jgi:DNA-binding Lrp family transcriptional regulator